MIYGKLIKKFIKSFFKKEIEMLLSTDQMSFLANHLYSLKKKRTEKNSQEYYDFVNTQCLEFFISKNDPLFLSPNNEISTLISSEEKSFSQVSSKDQDLSKVLFNLESNLTNKSKFNKDSSYLEIFNSLENSILSDTALDFKFTFKNFGEKTIADFVIYET